MRKPLLVALLILTTAPLFAQHAAFAGRHLAGHISPGFQNSGVIPSGTGFRHFGRGGFFLPYFDPLYADYLSDTGYPAAAEPPMIFVQAPQPVAEHSPTPAQPLMIELRGNSYVQITGDTDQQDRTIATNSASPTSTEDCHSERSGCTTTQSIRGVEEPRPPQREQAALLIFRDGHREEISSYTISGGTLYAAADFATSGTWTRTINLSSLNVQETVATNQSRGLPFRLPQFPNEVIVGP